MRQRRVKTLTFDYRREGFDIICFEGYMYLGDLVGNLPIRAEEKRFGTHLFIPDKTNVVQIGDERGSALWECLCLTDGHSLLYRGTLGAADGHEILVFLPLVNGRKREFSRDLFGNIAGYPYKNIFVVFNYLSAEELHITTCYHAARVFRPTVVYAEESPVIL